MNEGAKYQVQIIEIKSGIFIAWSKSVEKLFWFFIKFNCLYRKPYISQMILRRGKKLSKS